MACAIGGITKSDPEIIGVYVATHDLLGLVAAIAGIDIPVPLVTGGVEVAVERGDAVYRLDGLVISARPKLDHAATEHDVVGVVQVDQERVIGVVRVDLDRVEQVVVAGGLPD